MGTLYPLHHALNSIRLKGNHHRGYPLTTRSTRVRLSPKGRRTAGHCASLSRTKKTHALGSSSCTVDPPTAPSGKVTTRLPLPSGSMTVTRSPALQVGGQTKRRSKGDVGVEAEAPLAFIPRQICDRPGESAESAATPAALRVT